MKPTLKIFNIKTVRPADFIAENFFTAQSPNHHDGYEELNAEQIADIRVAIMVIVVIAPVRLDVG